MGLVRDHAAASGPFARLFSWTGALLFLISLGYFFFVYLTRFGVLAARGEAIAAVTWDVTLFTLFALHHSVFARERVRRWVGHRVPVELERSVYVWIASLLFVVVCASWRPIAGAAWQAHGDVLWMLRVLQGAGLWLTITGASVLDIRELAGLIVRRPAAEPEFKTTGPYGWIRHPIYAGWFLFVFAASPMTMTRLVFAIVSCAYVLVAIPLEERTLRAASRGAYDRYMAHVRWRLVPGVF